MFSPMFVRLANLYYLNKQYEECINTCKTGLEIYPSYLTAKLLLLKAFIKLEYINEAENLLDEVKDKISNPEIFNKLRNSISELENVSRQERIHYAPKHKPLIEFSGYEQEIKGLINIEPTIDLDSLLLKLDNNDVEELMDESSYKTFTDSFKKFSLNISKGQTEISKKESVAIKPTDDNSASYLSKVKIVTETLADIFAKQGNFKEAFNTYNTLLKTDNSNKGRILKKLSELEINFLDHRNN
jgi:tetratricopeptide (TPR) repeat protein